MSITRFHSALMFICTSALAATVLAVEPAAPSALELELTLARRPQLYLIVDLGRPSLDVKARGMVLDRTLLQGATIAALQPMVGRRTWPEFEPPLMWRVAEPPPAEWRRLVAPTELRPYDETDTETQQPIPTVTTTQIPSSYTLTVDTGWQLVITNRPRHWLWHRLAAAVANSWRRLTAQPESPTPPRLVLSMAPEDALRLLHIFQHDLPILVVDAQPTASGGGGGS